jgi:N-acetylneuraminic acid mutarotase
MPNLHKDRLLRPMALAATCLVVVSCSETTGPESIETPPVSAGALALASNTWVTRADLPSTERLALATAALPNAAGQWIVYAIGGYSGGSLSKVQAYNVATNSWTYKASLPIPLYRTNGAGVINGKIYVSGGISSHNNYHAELFMYNPATNTWTRKRDMPTQSFGGVTVVINNKLYVLTQCEQEWCDPFVRGAFYRYDPATDQWTVLPTPTTWSSGAMGGLIGGKFYVTGRENSLPQFAVYDPTTNQWAKRTPMNRDRTMGAGVALGGKLYVIGGWTRLEDGTLTAVRTTSVYDPSTDTWTNKAPLPNPRVGIAASRVVLNGQPRIELVGGARPGNNLQYIP